MHLADRVEFRRMDAEALSLEDSSFDAVVSLYALRHFPRPERALREMYRVLRPGGRIVIGVGSGPRRMSLTGIKDGLKRAFAALEVSRGRRLEAPHFLNELVTKHLSPGVHPEESSLARAFQNRAAVVPRLVRAAGFRRLRCVWNGFEAPVVAAEEFWELQATFSSLARKRLKDAPPGKVEAIRQEFFDCCEAVLRNGGRLVYPYAALLVCAVRG